MAQEEMIRGKDALKGCFFTGCASFIIGTLLLTLFIFREVIF